MCDCESEVIPGKLLGSFRVLQAHGELQAYKHLHRFDTFHEVYCFGCDFQFDWVMYFQTERTEHVGLGTISLNV